MGLFKPLPPRLQRAHPLARGLVGAWEFTEGAGLSAYDSSGYGNHGTLTAGATWAGGRTGAALSLNGTGAYLSVADSPGLNLSYFTVSGWINPISFNASDSSHWNYVFCKGDYVTGRNCLAMTIRSGNKIAALTADNVNYIENTGNGTALSLNQWQFVALTYDGANLRAYLNAVQQWVQADTRTPTTAGQILQIGQGTSYTTSASFAGSMDDVRIYNRALSAAEVASLFQMTGP